MLVWYFYGSSHSSHPNSCRIMNKIPFNQFKLLFQVQSLNFPRINVITRSLVVGSNVSKLTLVQKRIPGFLQTECSRTNGLSRTYSFFSRKKGNVPIKCKIRTNECGEKVAETYEAKTPSCIHIPPLSKDFTMNPDEICTKLKEEMVTYNPPPPDSMPSTSQQCSKPKFSCPNALTKYLKTRGECREVNRGVETNDCQKKNTCPKVKKTIFTGRDCALDPCNPAKPQTKRQKTKNVIRDMISKLKSKKLMKPSGFLDEDLLRLACRKLGSGGDKRSVTCVKLTSSGETSPFGVQNLRERIRGKVLEEFDAEVPLDKESVEVFLTQRDLLFDYLDREATNLSSSIVMSRSERTKKLNDILKIPENDGTKARKKVANKPKCRRRRRSRWFSKIPIEPNMKGSVIFANGTAQELDDPCKILSVNFSASNLHPTEEQTIVEPKETRCDSAIKRMLDNYDSILEKLTLNTLENLEKESLKGEESRCSLVETLMCEPEKETKDLTSNYEEISEQRLEPVVRQKKISKLDKTVKCYTTTVSPETQRQTKKRHKRVKKQSKSRLKVGSTDNLNTSLLEVNGFPKTTSSAALGERYHALTTNNLLIDFEKQEEVKKDEVKSDNSMVNIKDIASIYDEKEVPGDNSDSTKTSKNGTVLPGLTRPVTQKVPHLNLLDTKALRPVSSSWKKNAGAGGRLHRRISHDSGLIARKTKDKVGRKKAMDVTNKLDNLEIKGVDFQQIRLKSTDKTALSWKSRCEEDRRSCPTKKKNYNEKADAMYPLPLDWDYDERAPDEIARKWHTWECPKEEDPGCPITSEDLKRGAPHKKPVSAAAINRCNFDECKNRFSCRKPASRCRNAKKPLGPGK
ncbi:uncharacterized protein LOC123320221 [Coccinella septempunctata]|uniref:uncharacterized protein LOC123320221 n=1 Tax=Coccinella septempunctata TaxID=41139 RepID=UPI001D092901|nr:uncharacterized protein LOC123320221 [Coccinella septempunctata]